MENATKALLIAAAVLIAIVLIALGVRLLGSANDSSDQAGAVYNQMDDAMGQQGNSINESLLSITSTNH